METNESSKFRGLSTRRAELRQLASFQIFVVNRIEFISSFVQLIDFQVQSKGTIEMSFKTVLAINLSIKESCWDNRKV